MAKKSSRLSRGHQLGSTCLSLPYLLVSRAFQRYFVSSSAKLWPNPDSRQFPLYLSYIVPGPGI
jgi:hypothetical protein